MKKKLMALVGVALLVGSLTACGSTAEDTGAPVKESIEAVNESTGETAAESSEATDETSVEVSENATETTAEEITASTGDEVYTCEDYSISYNPADFALADVRGSIQLLYINEITTNTNEIIITKEEGTTVDEIISAIAGENADKINDGSLGSQVIPVKTYSYTFDSPLEEENPPLMSDSFMVMQCGDGVITIECVRTIEAEDEIDFTVEGAFTHSLESFVLNK